MTKKYVARQGIADRKGKTVFYELIYQSMKTLPPDTTMDVVVKDLVSTLSLDFKTQEITQGAKAFIHLPRHAIMSKAFLYLEPSDYVIQITDDVRRDHLFVERIENLRKKHYQFAIDEYSGERERDFSTIEKSISYIKVNFRAFTEAQHKEFVAEYKRRKRKTLIVENIETKEDYAIAMTVGYDYFQGDFFNQPTLIIKENIGFNQSSVLMLLKELHQEDADFQKIDRIINTDAGLTFRLLARGNTMAFAGKNKFTTASQVVVRMGMDELQKWATLMLMQDSAEPGQEEKLEQALLRAVFLESLALKIDPTLNRQECYFIYLKGMFTIFPVDAREEIFETMAFDLDPDLVDTANDLLIFNYAYEVGDYDVVDLYLMDKGLTELLVLACYKNAIQTVNDSFSS